LRLEKTQTTFQACCGERNIKRQKYFFVPQIFHRNKPVLVQLITNNLPGMQHKTDVEAITKFIHAESAFLSKLSEATSKVIVGQETMMDRLLIGLLTKGHILLEGCLDWRKHSPSKPCRRL